jgi:hypothetical protein
MSEEPKTPPKCTIRDEAFVEPCWALRETAQPSWRRAKGIVIHALVNVETLEPSRRMYAVRSGDHPKGVLLNFCPFCGVDISAPFKNESDT